ncbi:PTS lactose/cellobiose transporter subunit IIA [Fusibacter sp. Q10-2]|uniref:PTS lactose/cellobiose transporter subunit IIA n=2 Tax=Fusibacter ferrireducens TaxID=2785058 RepID=A0ABR9ZWY2_9FIRM|nr:PTS lactose/cellobiose transporter subunit IIA [Fusibacter ferrireducens]
MDEMMIFGIVSNAGNAKGFAYEAIEAAENNEFEKAEALLKEGHKALGEAHKAQTDMIYAEAQGDHVEFNIILVHAQDHLMTAMTELNMAEKFIKLYRRMEEQCGGSK